MEKGGTSNEKIHMVFYFWFNFSLVIPPLAYSAVGIIYAERNLTGEYVPILNGFNHSFMLIGTVIFSIGLIKLIKISKA